MLCILERTNPDIPFEQRVVGTRPRLDLPSKKELEEQRLRLGDAPRRAKRGNERGDRVGPRREPDCLRGGEDLERGVRERRPREGRDEVREERRVGLEPRFPEVTEEALEQRGVGRVPRVEQRGEEMRVAE